MDNDVNMLAAEVQRLEEAFESERTLSRRANRTGVVITSVLTLVVVGFLLTNYMNLSANWTADNFTSSLEREMSELSPVAINELNMLGQELLPVYADEGRKQLQALAPELSTRFNEQVDLLSGDVMKCVHDEMHDVEQRVMTRAEEVIFESYPSVLNAENRLQLKREFRAITEQAMTEALTNFDRKFSQDVEQVKQSFLKLDVADTDESTVELQKKFIRLWLQVLDQEIEEL